MRARIAVGIAGLALAGVVAGVGVASALRFPAPALVLRLWPFDPVSHAMLADAALQQPGGPRFAEAEEGAVRSLRQQAVNPLALRVLGLVRLQQGRNGEGESLMLASARQSRRDLGARLWMIERAIKRNDVPGALHEYDLTLRAIPASRALLFPTMTQALADREFVGPILDLFETQPPWLDDYLVFSVPSGIASANLAQVIARSRHLPSDRRLYHTIGLVDQLVRENRYAVASALYAAVTRRPAPVRAADSAFGSMNAVPPLDWRTVDIDGVNVGIDEANSLVVSGPIVRSAVALTRLLTLAPGAYTLSTTAATAGAGAGKWSLTCRANGAPIALLSLPRRAASATANFAIPTTGCTAQNLALVIDPGDTSDPLSLTIRSVAVRPQ